MKHNEVKKEDLTGFLSKARLFGQHGRGKNKAIDVITDPVEKRVWYEFSDDQKVLYKGPDLDEAIKQYNAA